MEKNYLSSIGMLKNKRLMNNKKKCLHALIDKIKTNGFKSNDQIILIIYLDNEEKFNEKDLYSLMDFKENTERIKIKTISEFIDEIEYLFKLSEYVIFYNFSSNIIKILTLLNKYLYYFTLNRKKVTFYHLSTK